ncbi:transposase [Desulfosediminicola flagellatus]|uniref:transposase n=1 Tax=Desulfosediminicola flagellatus TaxID=2569541 RepID=UPI003B838C8C
MTTDGNVTATVFIEFLKRLLYKANQPVSLILDNHSVRRSTEVREFVKSTGGRLLLFFLPPYS